MANYVCMYVRKSFYSLSNEEKGIKTNKSPARSYCDKASSVLGIMIKTMLPPNTNVFVLKKYSENC